jgi:hypothetical protein
LNKRGFKQRGDVSSVKLRDTCPVSVQKKKDALGIHKTIAPDPSLLK